MGANVARGENTTRQTMLVNGPSSQACAMASSLAYAVSTFSPMANGGKLLRGDPGYGVNRWTRRLGTRDQGPAGDPTMRAITPVMIPAAQSVRIGAQGGPSSPAAFPSSGDSAAFLGPVAGLDLGKLGNVSMGS